jgi:hypothetical protein
MIAPSYGLPGEKPVYCLQHKLINMIDIKGKRCRYSECIKYPLYNVPGNTAAYCSEHKTSDMMNVTCKRCNFQGCSKVPVYGMQGEKASYCVTHKSDDMVNVQCKQCLSEDCTKQPVYDIIGGKGSYCLEHKTSDMVNVRSMKCKYQGCTKHPTYGVVGTQGSYCIDHKSPDMINLKHHRCQYENCTTRSLYGKPGTKESHCGHHKQPGMIKRPKNKCTIKDCTAVALYGINSVARHCENHKEDTDDNLLERECVQCMLLMVLNKNELCEFCDPETFKTARLAKQNALMSYLDANGLPGDSTDKMIDGGLCGQERPDRIYDFGDKIVILECDEHQHKSRSCVCEQTRMVNIAQSLGGIPVHFIRWNPDDYDTVSDRKMPEQIQKRYKLVRDYIRDIKSGRIHIPKALVSVIYMYYDDFDGIKNEETKVL